MNDITVRINQIIDELNFIKQNFIKEQTTTEYCTNFKIALISKLQQAGIEYNPELEFDMTVKNNNTTDKKRFFAFKKEMNPTEKETLTSLKMCMMF